MTATIIPIDKLGSWRFGIDIDAKDYILTQERDNAMGVVLSLSSKRVDRTIHAVIPFNECSMGPNALLDAFQRRVREMFNDFKAYEGAMKYAKPSGGFRFRPGRRRVRLT